MNSTKPSLDIVRFTLLWLLASFTARAATYSVATNGVDTNPGSQASPFKTIQHGIGAAANGDTLQVAAGTYFEEVGWTNKNLSLLGAGPGQSVIDGSSSVTCLRTEF